MKNKLLTRDQFREGVFTRDGHTCVFCDSPAKDAHHILERRLFNDGGYYLNNGASVCEMHHLECESTKISIDEVREACKIVSKVIPDHLYPDTQYDKWGNVILEDGRRLPGELFYDPSVQKIMKTGPHMDQFTSYTRYPRTYHFPWTGSNSKDDRIINDLSNFETSQVVMTRKMDGSNVTMYSDFIHGRTLDHRTHPISGRTKAIWGQIQGNIPDGWRICGEDLFNKHSIYYDDLESYFYGFSIWNEKNECLAWDETLEYFQLLDIEPVQVLYQGPWNFDKISEVQNNMNFENDEGYIIRVADKFDLKDFKNSVGKFVRPGHHGTIIHNLASAHQLPNKLRQKVDSVNK